MAHVYPCSFKKGLLTNHIIQLKKISLNINNMLCTGFIFNSPTLLVYNKIDQKGKVEWINEYSPKRQYNP